MILNIPVHAQSHGDAIVELQRALAAQEENTPALKSCSKSLVKMTEAALESVKAGPVKIQVSGHYIGGWIAERPQNLQVLSASVSVAAV